MTKIDSTPAAEPQTEVETAHVRCLNCDKLQIEPWRAECLALSPIVSATCSLYEKGLVVDSGKRRNGYTVWVPAAGVTLEPAWKVIAGKRQ